LFQRNELGFGGGAAVLSLDATFSPLADQERAGLKRRIEAWAAEADLVVDLGARIGSREWWRGLATCGVLCATALAFAPSIRPFDSQPEAALAPAQWEEARTLAIAPLAYGADTGKRMTPTDAVEPLADTPERPSVDLSATLGQGDGFARVLERAGVAGEQAKQVAEMVASAVSLGDVKPGTRIELTLGRRPNKSVARPLDHLSFRAKFELALAVERVDGQLRLKRIPIAVDNTPLRIQGVVGSSLYQSARAAGAPAKAVETYLKTIGQRLSIGRDVRSDDKFDIIVEHRRAATGEVEVGALLYAGLDQGKRKMRLLKWETGGRTEWFEASGVGQSRGMMRTPVAGRMTSGFGMRLHPLLGYSRFHKGVDFGAAYGSPIVAAADGVVSYAGWHGGHGKFVKLSHSGGLGTGYAHMSRIVARPGQRVSQGQVIGYVGSTGMSTGPHLHYEVYKGGAAINPRSISFIQTAQLAGAELARFRARLNQLLAVRPGARGAKPQEAQGAEAQSAEAKPDAKGKEARKQG
jgi:murein DD-endopeptidase MepM/ murein hydrolase activator NlpD